MKKIIFGLLALAISASALNAKTKYYYGDSSKFDYSEPSKYEYKYYGY